METLPLKQTVARRGGFCEVRFAADVEQAFSSYAPSLTGKPGQALFVYGPELSGEVKASLERTCVSAGYATKTVCFEQNRLLSDVVELMREISQAGLSKEDMLVVAGDAELISLVSYAGALWCEGMPTVAFATSLFALMTAPSNPLPLYAQEGDAIPLVCLPGRLDACYSSPVLLGSGEDATGASGAAGVAGAAGTAGTGEESAGAGPARHGSKEALVLALKAAVCDGEEALKEYARLLEEKSAQAESELAVLGARWIGRTRAATSAAKRASLDYGRELAETLAVLLPDVPPAQAHAEGMRFSSRLGVSALDGDVELVYTQDALLDAAGLPELICDLDAPTVYDTFLETLHKRERRLLMALPYRAGSVRVLPLNQAILLEHIEAWCESRRRNDE